MKLPGPWIFWMVVASLLGNPMSEAQDKASSSTEGKSIEAKRLEAIGRGLDYLKKTGQAQDGTFSVNAGPGVTALVLTSMIRHGVSLEDASLKKGLVALEGFVKPDGGIYGNGRLMNYETCVSVLCFSEANRKAGDARYAKILANAKNFLLSLQINEEGSEESGGVGYAGKGRPDLSNTAYLLEALQSLEVAPNDPAVQRALAFVSRCQNLSSPHNDNPLVVKVNDGGFFYTIPNEQALESGDPNSPQGGLRSYGSMTYNGLKSMVYAGLDAKDQRVLAAKQWIGKHYTLSENPGMGQAGLYYYFHTFGAALRAIGEKTLVDNQGVERNWSRDLTSAIIQQQSLDGSWQNENRQWFENDRNLATAFALMALSYCEP